MEQVTEKQIKFMKALGIEWDQSKFLSKDDAKEAISDELVKRETKVVKMVDPPKPKTYNGGAMFTSYAKDIFCELVNTEKNLPDQMDIAITLVKQAKEAFE